MTILKGVMMNFKNARIIVFSGAGISAESGIATFRDGNGLWANYDPQIVCNYRNWKQHYNLVHEFYNKRRAELRNVKPNKAHEIIKHLSDEYPLINITQNVDDLFERAGCKDVIHLHGNLLELRCETCKNIIPIGYEVYNFTPCPKCGTKQLKPNVVFFYEQAPRYADMYEIFAHIRDCDIVLVVGTSGEVININFLLTRGYKILNNLQSQAMIDESVFDSVYLESSTTALPKIYDEIRKLIGA